MTKFKQQSHGKDLQSTTMILFMQMILPQVHLRKPCYDFSFL